MCNSDPSTGLRNSKPCTCGACAKELTDYLDSMKAIEAETRRPKSRMLERCESQGYYHG